MQLFLEISLHHLRSSSPHDLRLLPDQRILNFGDKLKAPAMRLINTSTLELMDFSLKTIPPYAILSHTWSIDEVTFQDMVSSNVPSKKGYKKIEQVCRLARENGLELAWVDTCCIDKTSSAELTESINSMYRWYRDAAVCYVYLEDLEPNTVLEDGLANCRWLTRGWTLQEFIAPKDVVFYDMVWNWRETKLAMFEFLSKLTNIPRRVLQTPELVYQHSVATRMTWAAKRTTTRMEDTAYCLLGIFDVNMPLIYGEGTKAFRRLQEEIIKRSTDLTIFAWQSPSDQDPILGLFASSPETFIDGDWSGGEVVGGIINYSVTNQGLLVSGSKCLGLAIVTLMNGSEGIRYFFSLVKTGFGARKSGIYLRKLGPRIFYRDGRLPPDGWSSNIVGQLLDVNTSSFYILSDPIDTSYLNFESSRYRAGAIYVPKIHYFSLEMAVPEDLWDASDSVFLIPYPHSSARYPMVLAMRLTCTYGGASFPLIVLCYFLQEMSSPSCKLFGRGEHPRLEAMLFNRRDRNEYLYWADMWVDFPEILDLKSDCLEMRIDNLKYTIAVTFQQEILCDMDDEGNLDESSSRFTMGFAIS